METVFSLKNKDLHYLSRRENAIIIAVDVQDNKIEMAMRFGATDTVNGSDGQAVSVTGR